MLVVKTDPEPQKGTRSDFRRLGEPPVKHIMVMSVLDQAVSAKQR